MDPNWPGNAGQYLKVLKFASEYGLSLDTCGREWDWSMPSGAESGDGIGGHRGAAVGVDRRGVIPSLASMACSMNSFASVPFSVGQASQ